MERQVKERLVGAAVLIAAAVILIPELLSGPKQPATAPAPARAGEAPMKTYTIDLNRPEGQAAVEEQAPPQEAPTAPESQPATQAPAAHLADDEAAVSEATDSAEVVAPAAQMVAQSAATPARPVAEPPAPAQVEQKPAASRPEVKPESAAVRSSTPVRSDKPAAQPPAEVAESPRQPSPPKAPEAAPPKALVSAAKAPTLKQWAVQLGSFSSKVNAERLVKEWEGRGQRGSVSPVQAASGTLYRARLGPFTDREAADATLRKVRDSVNGAAIVALP